MKSANPFFVMAGGMVALQLRELPGRADALGLVGNRVLLQPPGAVVEMIFMGGVQTLASWESGRCGLGA